MIEKFEFTVTLYRYCIYDYYCTLTSKLNNIDEQNFVCKQNFEHNR